MHPETKQSRRVRISSSKKIQICTGNVEDKFSSLHESVLSRILSYLPTVEAVRTSVLSKSWRNMWTNITDLQFDDRRHRDPRDYRFTEFVERVLRDIGSPQINSFHLRSVNSYDETLLISWLSNVLRRNLQRLVIRVLASKLEKITFSGDDSQKILLSFPPSLPDAYLALSRPNWPKKFLHSFTCVKSLGLELSKDFEVVKVPKFRQLVYLHLIYDMTQHSKFRKFLKSAPMLEMLSIRDLASPGSVTSSKTLKRLRLKKAPDCIRTMLKVLQIRNFNTSELQLSVLRYVMENAGILGPIILSTPKPITEESKALVLSYPKASPHASVFFE